MVQSAAITIRRQVLDVDLRASEADGLALQRRVPGICTDVLASAIEAALAPYDPGEGHLGIERVEIELRVPLDRFETDLAEGVRRELAEWFRRHASTGPPVTDGVRHRSRVETLDSALAEFLATGRLPWSFDVPAGTSLERLVLDSWTAGGGSPVPSPDTRARLVEVLHAPAARTRLVLQFSSGFATVVLRAIASPVADAAEQVLRTIERSGGAGPRGAQAARAGFVRQLLEAALEAAASSGASPGPAQLAARAWARTLLSAPTTPTERSEQAGRALARVLEEHWPGVTAGAARPGPAGRSEPARTTATSRPTDRIEAGEVDEDPGGLLVDNAGIVLLHPFLPRFLEGLGVARGAELLDPARALVLLHHLATGERTAPEHRLTLAKVLCGVPSAQPVPADVGLTDEETAEATALLEAVIGHWEVLRDTSPDALRGEFLTRPGLLSVTDEGDRLLRVEARSVDVLLDPLPWGLSLVGLPWMAALLQVEWR